MAVYRTVTLQSTEMLIATCQCTELSHLTAQKCW